EAAGEGAAVRELERDRDVAVADHHELGARQVEGRADGRLVEDVLPDRVARAPVEELRALALAGWLERGEEVAQPVVELVRGPACAPRRVGWERGGIRAADRGEVVVSEQADVGAVARRLDAPVRLRAVADDVAEAPDLVGALALDVCEHRLERMP